MIDELDDLRELLASITPAAVDRWRLNKAQAIVDRMADAQRIATPDIAPPTDGTSEAHAQSVVRLDAAAQGVWLTRNNVGVLQDRNGRPVRYGLANESKQQNEVMKSADLIGIRPVAITPDMIGGTIGQFVSREVKPAGWSYTGTGREAAQMTWARLVIKYGGDAKFATGAGSF